MAEEEPEDDALTIALAWLLQHGTAVICGHEPDPERAMRGHSPAFEPYAGMPRGRLVQLMDRAIRAGDIPRWEMLGEFLLDKLDAAERRRFNAALRLSSHLLNAAADSGLKLGPKEQGLLHSAACESIRW